MHPKFQSCYLPVYNLKISNLLYMITDVVLSWKVAKKIVLCGSNNSSRDLYLVYF